MTQPIQKPGRSKQDYCTPDDFFTAVRTRFGHMQWDLAASEDNAKAFEFFTEQEDALVQPWHNLKEIVWFNPLQNGKICECKCHLQRFVAYGKNNGETRNMHWPAKGSGSAPSAERLNLWIQNTFQNALACGQDFQLGVSSALETILNRSKKLAETIQCCELNYCSKNLAMLNQPKAEPRSESNQFSATSSESNENLGSFLIGDYPTGSTVNVGGDNAAPTVDKNESSQLSTTSQSVTLAALEQCLGISYPLAEVATALKVHAAPLIGAAAREDALESKNIFPPCHSRCRCLGVVCKQHPWLFVNPPFADIAPWVKKAREESLLGAKVLMLLPAGVGSNWFKNWVFEKAFVLFLSPRMTFKGSPDPYPKDLMLLDFDPAFKAGGFGCWRWKP